MHVVECSAKLWPRLSFVGNYDVEARGKKTVSLGTASNVEGVA